MLCMDSTTENESWGSKKNRRNEYKRFDVFQQDKVTKQPFCLAHEQQKTRQGDVVLVQLVRNVCFDIKRMTFASFAKLWRHWRPTRC